ncbi:MAG: metallophosphoesterase [Bacteroidales bacterium]|nr:metallophosphoesterase [Bacteroidales bacterium]
MAILKRNHLLLLLLFGTSCDKNLDYKGLFYSESAVNLRYEESMVWNRAHSREITVQDTVYKMIFTGDTHIGGVSNLNKVMEIAAASGAVCLAIAGDITTGRPDDFARAAVLLNATAPYEVALTTGNHDLFFGGWQWYYRYFGSSVYTLKVHYIQNTDLFIFLDTGSGTLGSLQYAWLKDELLKRNNYRNVVVVTHLNLIRNLMTSTTNLLVQEMNALLDLFARNRISMVIMAHDHARYTERFGNTTYITLDALVDDDPDASYLMLTGGTKGVTYRFVEL